MNQTAEATSKITNPERILRIVARMCDGQMQVLIRTKENLKVGIRANFTRFDGSKHPPQIVFDKISEFGLQKLEKGIPVKVEVIGMPSKVMFVTTINEKLADSIRCNIPASLVTIERRQNSRYRVLPSSMAYLSFSLWQPQDDDPSAAPFFDAYRGLAAWIPIMDISAGGICVQSHFPSFMNALEAVELDPKARLHLPMSAPIPVQAAIRWRRRIKNRIHDEKRERIQLDFRLGIEFHELQEEFQLKIRNYLRQLSVADAI